MAERYDAVIIGGGHNGLTTAAYLAKAGWKTLVLEKRHILGGATTSDEIVPGYTFSVLSYVVSLLRPEIIRELELPKHGLEILPLDGTFTPVPGDYLWRTDDHAATMREIRRWSRSDADAYEEYGQLMADMARFIKPILGIVPPDPTSIDPRDWLGVMGLARDFARLPERQQAAFIGLMTMSAADFLDQWFETEPLKATMSASGIIGTFLGVRSPGTAYVLLHHYMGEIDGAFRAWGLHKGGTGAISYAIANAARALGAEIRTDADVAQVRLSSAGDRATGVVLASGEEIDAGVVVSSADLRRTFLQLLEPGILPEDFEAAVRRFKFRGSSGKVNLALDALPTFTTNPGGTEYLRGAMSISPAVDYMERAYDDAKYGRFSRRPYVDIVIPSPRRPVGGPAGQARHELLRAVRAVQPGGRAGRLGEPARGVRQHRDRHDQRVRPEPSRRHRRLVRRDALGHGEGLGADRGQHLPRRALARAALLQPAGARLVALPDADPRLLDGRVVDPPGRRDHGGQRAPRSPGAPARRRRGRWRSGRDHAAFRHVRRDRRRRRPQRPRRGGLPRQGRAPDAPPREARDARRDRRDADPRRRLPRAGPLPHGRAAAPGRLPRARPRGARPRRSWRPRSGRSPRSPTGGR